MAISDRDLQFIVRLPNANERPDETVSRLQIIADLLQVIDKAIACAWPGVDRAGLAKQIEEDLTDYDFLFRATTLRETANKWQGELDAEPA